MQRQQSYCRARGIFFCEALKYTYIYVYMCIFLFKSVLTCVAIKGLRNNIYFIFIGKKRNVFTIFLTSLNQAKFLPNASHTFMDKLSGWTRENGSFVVVEPLNEIAAFALGTTIRTAEIKITRHEMIAVCGPVTAIEFVQKIQEMHNMRPHEDRP